jgi:quinol monooxygenase YgiN
MLIELRQYRTEPGQRDRLVAVMEEDVIPFQSSKGMVIVGSFVAEEDPDAYVWIRRFDDEAQRVAQYAAVYESDHWKTQIAPKFAGVLVRESINVTRLVPTPRSVIR